MTDKTYPQSERFWWCNTHQRPAPDTFKYPDGREGRRCRGGGILLPCRVVELTGLLEIEGPDRK